MQTILWDQFYYSIYRYPYMIEVENGGGYVSNNANVAASAYVGDNAYADDLNLVAIKLSDIADYSKIVLPRFQVGGRWFDDIVDNNRRREEEKLADELNDDDEITINED